MLPLVVSRRYALVPAFGIAPGLKALLANRDGLPCAEPRVPIEIVTGYGNTKSLRFFYDTGADHMVIPVYTAQKEGIRYREHRSRIRHPELTG